MDWGTPGFRPSPTPRACSHLMSIKLVMPFSIRISQKSSVRQELHLRVEVLTPKLFIQFSSVQSLSHVPFFATPWTATLQASLSITNSQSLLKLMSIELVVPSNHLILCHPLLLLPSIFPNIRVFSSGSVSLIRWPKYWSFSFTISPSNEYSGLISFRIDCFCLL